MKLVKTIMMVKTKAADNNNKFYEVNLYSDDTVVGRNGRVGTDGVLQKKGPIGEFGWEKLVFILVVYMETYRFIINYFHQGDLPCKTFYMYQPCSSHR
jgi:hypothetical protein